MIDIVSQNNLDVTFFISNDEPSFKVAALVLGLMKKGYTCDGESAAIPITKTYGNEILTGIRTRFTKQKYSDLEYSRYHRPRSVFKRIIYDNNETVFKFSITKGIAFNKINSEIRISPSEMDKNNIINNTIMSRYSRHLNVNDLKISIPQITSQYNIQDNIDSYHDNDRELLDKQINMGIIRFKEIENNFRVIFPCLAISNITKAPSPNQSITFAEFEKLLKHKDVIDNVTIPSTYTRNRFIDLCNIFKNNKVIDKLKSNNFEFRKVSTYNRQTKLNVSFFGITMISDSEFEVFRYFDHPGINFCADFLDKTGTLDKVEANMSKEIIAGI